MPQYWRNDSAIDMVLVFSYSFWYVVESLVWNLTPPHQTKFVSSRIRRGACSMYYTTPLNTCIFLKLLKDVVKRDTPP